MILTLDIGNTHIYAGVFNNEKLALQFRYPSTTPCTSDVFGLFLLDVLERNHLAAGDIQGVVIGSVVPELDYSVVAACKKYFSLEPLVLKAGVKTGLKLKIKNPVELGADLIAGAIAATEHFPKRHIIVVDFGTATTVSALGNDNSYLGTAILPGIKLSMKALSQNAAKLADIDIEAPENVIGRTTAACIQSGLYYGQLGAVKELVQRMSDEIYQGQVPMLLGTGGYAQLFAEENYFTAILPDLVLQGLRLAWEKNQ